MPLTNAARVFYRRIDAGRARSAIAFFTVTVTATPFLMPPTTFFAIAAIGIAALVFLMPGPVPWLRALTQPNRSERDDALDLSRMDDDGG